jgi:hypothetical protein
MTCKRLEVICHEDIDTQSQPWIVPFVFASMAQACEWYMPDVAKLGKSRMAVGNSIRMMCRAKKSREGDHFAAACGWSEILEQFVPTLPDWVYDGHTEKGRRAGRGIEPDSYASEAHRLWRLRASRKTTPATGQGELQIEDE